MIVGSIALGLGVGGCPPGDTEPDASVDAFRIRPDVYFDDAYLDPTIDAYLLDVFIPGADTRVADSNTRPMDSPLDLDAGMIDQCEGVAVPPTPCSNDDECRSMGLSRCELPIVGTGGGCMPCTVLIDECRTAEDCFLRATTDAGGPVFVDDADIPGPDAGPPVDPSDLVCNTYNEGCACPIYVCEPRCEGAACPDASCVDDGYVCPTNSTCTPSDPAADPHGCAPKACTTTADCDCGFCTRLGLCARGAGTCT